MPLSWVIIFPWEEKIQVNLQVIEVEIAADFAKQIVDIVLVWKGRWKVTWKLLWKSWEKNSFLDGRVGEGDKSWEDSFVAYWIKEWLVWSAAFFLYQEGRLWSLGLRRWNVSNWRGRGIVLNDKWMEIVSWRFSAPFCYLLGRRSIWLKSMVEQIIKVWFNFFSTVYLWIFKCFWKWNLISVHLILTGNTINILWSRKKVSNLISQADSQMTVQKKEKINKLGMIIVLFLTQAVGSE